MLILSLLAFSIPLSASIPIIIKAGVGRDHSLHQDGGSLASSSARVLHDFEADRGFGADDEGRQVSAHDAGNFANELSDRKFNLDERDSSGEKFLRVGGDEERNSNNRLNKKKGHHNSGFQNSYHKEESGSKSSYYDDSDDEGGRFEQNAEQGAFGDVRANKDRGSFLDGRGYSNQDVKHGQYIDKGLYGKDYGNKRNYNREKYIQDNEHQGQSNQGNRFGENGQYYEERYHQPHYNSWRYHRPEYDYNHHQGGFGAVPRRSITIYEDPRVYRDDHFSPSRYETYPDYNRNADEVYLDIRRPVNFRNNYYDRKQAYDPYY